LALQIVVAAYSGEPPSSLAGEARGFVERLAALCPSSVLFLGGYRGLMRVVAEEALRRGLRVVFVIPEAYEGDRFPQEAVVVRTGLGVRERSSVLVRSGDALAVLGGGLGTLFEVLLACSYGIPVYYLRGAGTRGLLTERFAGCIPDGVVDERVGCRVSYVSSGPRLAEELCRRLVGR
jgi:uncharacterized protein (TIGR00725 family)